MRCEVLNFEIRNLVAGCGTCGSRYCLTSRYHCLRVPHKGNALRVCKRNSHDLVRILKT